jgi:hypothetical protein
LPRSSLAQLQATIFDDALPNGVVTAAWSVVAGPESVTFAQATAALEAGSAPQAFNTTASFAAPGSYTLRLTVSDSQYSARRGEFASVR